MMNTSFGNELDGNHLNPLERRILSQDQDEDLDDADDSLEGDYTVKVGDICFVALGQMVGRSYCAVRYQPSAILVINSPVASKKLRQRTRDLWSSPDPVKKLFESLLLDYATEGIFDGKTFHGLHESSEFQIHAAVRLLYYFPRESAPLIAERIRSLAVDRRVMRKE